MSQFSEEQRKLSTDGYVKKPIKNNAYMRPETCSFLEYERGCTDLVVRQKLCKQENFLTNVLEERYRILI